MSFRSFIAVICFINLLTIVPLADADIVNGGFETDANSNNVPDGWASTVTGSDSATFNYVTGGTAGVDVHSGTSAVTIESSSGGSARWFTTNANLSPVTEAQEYAVTVWFKVEGADSDDEVQIKVDWFNSSGTHIGSSAFFNPPGAGNTGWQEAIYQLTAPSGAAGAKPVIYFTDGVNDISTTGSKATIDDVSINAVPEPGSLSLLAVACACLLGNKKRM